MEVNVNTLHEDMLQLRKEFLRLREYLEDSVLTAEDISALEDAEKDYKEGKTKRL